MRTSSDNSRSCITSLALAGLLGAGSFGLGCTDVPVEASFPDLVPNPEAELRIEGDFCTDSPEDVVFPVKILFVIDTSGSAQFTDPDQKRALAVEQVVERYVSNPGVQFGVISFSGRTALLTDGFTNNRQTLDQAVEQLREADSVTDYQGALGLAFTTLLGDMQASEPAERARSKYVVVFFSDGSPQPQCSREGDEGDKFLVCESPKDQVNVPNDVFPDLQAGGDYNQPYQIVDKIDLIMALKQEFRVGDLRFHTGFLYDEEEAAIAEGAFSLDAEAGEELLRSMATHGKGSFLKFSEGAEIDFLSLDYNSIKRPFVVKSFLVSNESAVPTEADAQPDSDRDGLSDLEEFGLGTDALEPDTDGDGFGDLFEARRFAQGHDPVDPDRPLTRCEFVADRGREDPDRDGLNNCEEALLGSNGKLFDSDADGIPDRLEFMYGLDPSSRDDGERDLDLDGARNFEEVRWHTDPTRRAVYQPGGHDRYRYRMVQTGQTFDGRHCSWFEVRHVGLVTPDREAGERFGVNRLMIYLGQVPEDQPADYGVFRVACAEARFVSPDYRVPTNGTIRLVANDFIRSAEFDPNVHCLPASDAAGDD